MTDEEYVRAAWAAYVGRKSIKELAQDVSSCHPDAKDLVHTVRGKLWRLRNRGHSVPHFNPQSAARVRFDNEKAVVLAKAVIEYMESEDGPLWELWDEDMIFSQEFVDNHPDGRFDRTKSLPYHDDNKLERQQAFAATLQDIRDGKVVSYQSITHADDCEQYAEIRLYMDAIQTLEEMR